MKANKRKGFTLVELLVVIAILAVLATVSVIGYLSFTNKAKESNDISLTTQMNLALQANEAVDGKAKTMTDALNVLSDAGLDVTKLTPTSQGYSYVYDSESGRMLLLGKDKNIIAPEGATDSNKIDTFAIVKTEEELSDWTEADYGIYLADGYTGTTELTTLTSVDVGNESIKSLTIADDSSTENAIINGNLDNLKLNVPEGSVDFYGDATFADVVTANHSFHVYGNIDQLNVTGGKVVVENGGVVSTIDTSKATSSVEVLKENGGTIGAVVVGESENVTIGSNIEKVDISAVAIGFAGGVGTEESPYLIANEENFANINSLSNDMENGKKYHFLLLNNLYIDDTYKVNIGDETIIENFRGVFDGDGNSLNVYTNHTNYTSSTSWFAVFYNLIASDDECTEIKNLNVYYKEMEASWVSLSGYIGISGENGVISFENINFYNVSGTIFNTLGNNNGLLGGYVYSSIIVKNCNNYANMNIAGISGVWTGAFYGPSLTKAYITFDNVNNYASISGNKFAYYTGNSSYLNNYNLRNHITITNSHNYGSVLKFSNKEFRLFGDVSGDNLILDKELFAKFNGNDGVARNIVSTGNIKYSVESNSKLNVEKSSDLSIVEYQVKYSSHYSSKSTGQNGGFTFIFNLEKDIEYIYNASFATVVDNNFDGYDIISNVPASNPTNIPFSIGVKDGKTYYIINNLYDFLPFADAKDVTLGGTSIQIVGLDTNGNIIDYRDVL